jgi:putative effector of murein hydrolase LrgA (UPF0299 family)
MSPVLAVTLYMRPLDSIPMKMFDDLSTAMAVGLYTLFAVATTGPLMLTVIEVPLPATVVMMPVLTVTFRMRLLRVSAM